jgi:hypothetical protein
MTGRWPRALCRALPWPVFLYYDIQVREFGINASARRHRIEDTDITHAVFSDDIDPERPVRRLLEGHGND